MLNLNVNVVMKNVHDVLPHMIARGSGRHRRHQFAGGALPDALGAGLCRLEVGDRLLRADGTAPVFKHGIRVGAISPGLVITSLLADWPADKLEQARASGSLIEAREVAEVVLFMLTRPRGMTIRDVVMLPTNFDL